MSWRVRADDLETISGPYPASNFSAWYDALVAYRTAELARVQYNDSVYRMPELKWTQSSFIQPQMVIPALRSASLPPLLSLLDRDAATATSSPPSVAAAADSVNAVF